jgi:phospholipid/cholesterol/gamma-HCH transport system permease protein
MAASGTGTLTAGANAPRSAAGLERFTLPRSAALADAITHLGGVVLLGRDSARALLRRRWEWRSILAQLEQIGVRSLSIVALTAVFTGMVLALQMGSFLGKFGAKIFVSRIVGLSLLRELGPVLTALMIAGRVGAGITAELGSMRVTEQIDAMRALGADPIHKLVVPRLLALAIMLPLLTVLGDCLGVLGGALISVTELRVGGDFYFKSLLQYLTFGDLGSGVGKTVFFAVFIALIACYNGLRAEGGADGVGRATTATVVAGSITVLVSDFFLTKLFLVM